MAENSDKGGDSDAERLQHSDSNNTVAYSECNTDSSYNGSRDESSSAEVVEIVLGEIIETVPF